MNLQVEPVRRTARPRYPTKLDILADPKLLEQHVPLAWLSPKEVAGAFSILLAAGIAGCGGGTTVAPVFRHGEGRGATGCVVVSPPAFLSEEEALQVVKEELADYPLEFTESEIELPSIEIPRRERQWNRRANFRRFFMSENEDPTEFYVTKYPGNPLVLDLRDPEKKVGIEFVSRADYMLLGGVDDRSSDQGYNMPEVAEFASKYVRGKEPKDTYLCFLYDPLSRLEDETPGDSENWQDYWQRTDVEKKKESVRLLREQVRDFAEWLKGQGVI